MCHLPRAVLYDFLHDFSQLKFPKNCTGQKASIYARLEAFLMPLKRAQTGTLTLGGAVYDLYAS